jgi:hypothetical protein
VTISYDYAREPNDAYYEPAWCDDSLFRFLALPAGSKILDPACGTGTVVEAARRAGLRAAGTDLVKRWPDGTPNYFVINGFDAMRRMSGVNAIVSNPPYKIARDFAEVALSYSPIVAFLLPNTWIQGSKRSMWLETTPLRWFLPLAPRPSMPPIGSDVKPEGGKVDYAWFVWELGYKGAPEIKWLRK